MKWRSLSNRFDEWYFGPTPREWSDWFAWYPVRIGDNVHWLETVETRMESGRYGSWWEYRVKK